MWHQKTSVFLFFHNVPRYVLADPDEWFVAGANSVSFGLCTTISTSITLLCEANTIIRVSMGTSGNGLATLKANFSILFTILGNI